MDAIAWVVGAAALVVLVDIAAGRYRRRKAVKITPDILAERERSFWRSIGKRVENDLFRGSVIEKCAEPFQIWKFRIASGAPR